MDDIIKGYQYLCALDESTCLECLLLDGEEVKGNFDKIHDGCRCVKLPIVKTFNDLGINLPEIRDQTRSSAIGPVPESGGLYKKYLIERARASKEKEQSGIELLGILEKVYITNHNESETYNKIKMGIYASKLIDIDKNVIMELIKKLKWPSPGIEQILVAAIRIGEENISREALVNIEKQIQSFSPTFASMHISSIYTGIAKAIMEYSKEKSIFYYLLSYRRNPTATTGIELLKLYKTLKQYNEYNSFLNELMSKFPNSKAVQKFTRIVT